TYVAPRLDQGRLPATFARISSHFLFLDFCALFTAASIERSLTAHFGQIAYGRAPQAIVVGTYDRHPRARSSVHARKASAMRIVPEVARHFPQTPKNEPSLFSLRSGAPIRR